MLQLSHSINSSFLKAVIEKRGREPVDQETCPLRLSVPFVVGARILTLKFLEAVT